MPNYLVKQAVKHDGKSYVDGDTIKLPEAEAQELIDAGILGQATKPSKSEKPSDAVLLQQIIDAVASLDKDDADLWTNSGKAQVAAIEAVLGFDISAKDRDAALASIEKTGAAE